MSQSKLRIIAVLSLLVVLTFLFFKTRSVAVAEHDRYMNALRLVKEEDAELKQEILKISSSAQRSYDSVVEKFQHLGQLLAELREVPAFVGAESAQSLVGLLEEYGQLLEAKRALFQRFRRANVRLRNSLGYLPLLASELTQTGRTSRPPSASPDHLRDLLRDVLLFVLSADPAISGRVDNQLGFLEQSIRTGEARGGTSEIGLLVAHVRTILRYKPELDQLSAEVLSMPIRSRSGKAPSLHLGARPSIGVRSRTGGL